MSDLSVQALINDSNLEMDWLWGAQQATTAADREYCLKRALYINPESETARRELAILHRNQRAAAKNPVTASSRPAFYEILRAAFQR
ncbi:MAG TPA: hypothetical protein VMT34_04570 [Aggregatilineales bacterium]|nr:hypothetical protein [Aggregatilineales bacterium]